MTSRAAIMRLLWAAVRRIGVGGEDALRAAVARLNDRDATNAEHKGTVAYSSTRMLTQQQLYELADDFRRKAGLPAATRQQRGPRGGRPRRPNHLEGVSFIASQGERDYVAYLFECLKWSTEAAQKFIERQTKGVGLGTHTSVNAVVAPLERMLRSRGWELIESDHVKRWLSPTPEGEVT